SRPIAVAKNPAAAAAITLRRDFEPASACANRSNRCSSISAFLLCPEGGCFCDYVLYNVVRASKVSRAGKLTGKRVERPTDHEARSPAEGGNRTHTRRVNGQKHSRRQPHANRPRQPIDFRVPAVVRGEH